MPVFATGNQWSTGLCECCSHCSSCCESIWCQPCQIGYQYGFLEYGRRNCNGNMCLLSSCLPMITAADVRGRIRRAYKIEGNCCFDAMAAWMCTPCVVAQNYREISARGHWSGGVCTCAPYVRYQSQPMMVPVMGEPLQDGGNNNGYGSPMTNAGYGATSVQGGGRFEQPQYPPRQHQAENPASPLLKEAA